MIELLKNKKIPYILSGILIIIFFSVFAIKEISDGKKQIKALKEQQKEILILKNEFLSLKQKIDAIESKKNLSNVQGIIEAVEEVFSSIGLKDKIKTIKSTARREIKDGIEEEADIYIEKVSMNEMMNIFYRIENAPIILTIKKATIKKSFENPELLNITLILSFFKTR